MNSETVNDDELAGRAVLSAHEALLEHAEQARRTSARELWILGARRRKRVRVLTGASAVAVTVGLGVPIVTQILDEPGVMEPAAPAATESSPVDEASFEDMVVVTQLVAALSDQNGFAGVQEVHPQITIDWVGVVPQEVRDQVQEIAGDREVTFDESARRSESDMWDIVNSFEDQRESLGIVIATIHPANDAISIEALPDSPLHTAANPQSLLGIPEEVTLFVSVMLPENRPSH